MTGAEECGTLSGTQSNEIEEVCENIVYQD